MQGLLFCCTKSSPGESPSAPAGADSYFATMRVFKPLDSREMESTKFNTNYTA